MAYSTRHLSPEYRDAVLRLWKDNMSDPRIADVLDERYHWLYDRNPAGPPTTVIALQTERSEAVGCGSVYPRRMQVDGASMLAAVPADFAVDRKHRLGGAALMIQRALLGQNGTAPSFLFGFPNKSSLPILQRVGYKPVTAAQGWVKPLRSAYKLRGYLRSERGARIAAAPIDLGLAALDFVRTAGRGGRVEVLERADERFDRLWERAKDNYGLTGERTARYLNWRYAEFTTATYRFFCLLDRDGTNLLGYAVYAIRDGKASVVDLFAIDMEATADRLLMLLSRHLRRERCVSVYVAFAGRPDFAARLPRLGFYRSRGAERKLVAFAGNLNAKQEAMLFDEHNWYMFDGEMDI